MNQATVTKIGWFASLLAVAMFVSYIDQIRLNMTGQSGSIILPIVTSINCSAWMSYALLKTKTDWPILFCNSVGLLMGLATAVTALLY